MTLRQHIAYAFHVLRWWVPVFMVLNAFILSAAALLHPEQDVDLVWSLAVIFGWPPLIVVGIGAVDYLWHEWFKKR
jgi:hypothetical protein